MMLPAKRAELEAFVKTEVDDLLKRDVPIPLLNYGGYQMDFRAYLGHDIQPVSDLSDEDLEHAVAMVRVVRLAFDSIDVMTSMYYGRKFRNFLYP